MVDPKRHPCHRRCRISRLASVRSAAGGWPRCHLRRQFLHRAEAEHRAPDRPSALRADAPRRDAAALRGGRRDLQSRLSGFAGALPARPGADDQDQRARRDQHAGSCQAPQMPHLPGVDLGGLRRSLRASPDRGLLGQRQSGRPAGLLRRGQALRRDAVLRLPPPARSRDQGGAHLQHLRAAHGPQRRPGRVELHRAGLAGQADHDLRRRHADAIVLLRRRSDRRPSCCS